MKCNNCGLCCMRFSFGFSREEFIERIYTNISDAEDNAQILEYWVWVTKNWRDDWVMTCKMLTPERINRKILWKCSVYNNRPKMCRDFPVTDPTLYVDCPLREKFKEERKMRHRRNPHKSKSFYKNYPNRKDWRAQYRDSRRFDPSCTSSGDCDYCRMSRLRHYRIANISFREQMEELENE